MGKVQSAYNRHLCLPFLVLATALAMTVAFAQAQEWELFALGLLFVLLFTFVICIQPLKVVFGKDEIRIIYVMGVRDMIPIDRITTVYEQGSVFSGGWPVYVLCYPHTERKPFFKDGQIPRTARTQKILRELRLIGQEKRRK